MVRSLSSPPSPPLPFAQNVIKRGLSPQSPTRELLDLFGDSLKFVDRLYTAEFGAQNRKVPAHMPHMIDRDIMEELQQRWWAEWDATSSHRLRSGRDMQYAFSFFYYLMSRNHEVDLRQVFSRDVDTSQDGVVSDNELRTVVARLEESVEPGDVAAYRSALLEYASGDQIDYDTFVAAVHAGVLELEPIVSQLGDKYEVVGTDDISFLMLHDNATVVEQQLDGIRRRQTKFNCLNDNMNHTNPDSDEAVRTVKRFYEALFPIASQFELPGSRPNRALHVDELGYDSHLFEGYGRVTWFLLGLVVALIGTSLFVLCNPDSALARSIQEYRRRRRAKKYTKLLKV